MVIISVALHFLFHHNRHHFKYQYYRYFYCYLYGCINIYILPSSVDIVTIVIGIWNRRALVKLPRTTDTYGHIYANDLARANTIRIWIHRKYLNQVRRVCLTSSLVVFTEVLIHFLSTPLSHQQSYLKIVKTNSFSPLPSLSTLWSCGDGYASLACSDIGTLSDNPVCRASLCP